MKAINVSLAEIVSDPGAQARCHLDQGVVAEYVDLLVTGALPPIQLIGTPAGEDLKGPYYLADGWHRVAACRRLGRLVLAEILPPEPGLSPQRTAVLRAVGANASHGLRRTRADVARACEILLRDPEWSAWSDREIARRVGCDHRTVGARRAELTASGEIPQIGERTVQRGGQTYQQAPRQPASPPSIWIDPATGKEAKTLGDQIALIRQAEPGPWWDRVRAEAYLAVCGQEIRLQNGLLSLIPALDLAALEDLRAGRSLAYLDLARNRLGNQIAAICRTAPDRPGVLRQIDARIAELRAAWEQRIQTATARAVQVDLSQESLGEALETLAGTPWVAPQPAPIPAPSSVAADLKAAKEAAAEKLAAAREAATGHLAHARDLVSRESGHLLLSLPSIPEAVLPYAYDLEIAGSARPEILSALEDRIVYLRLGPRWAVEIVVQREADALRALDDLELDSADDLDALIRLEERARPPGRAALLEAARQLAAEIREVDAAALAAEKREIEELREEISQDSDPELLALLAARLIRLCEPTLAREIVDWIQERISRAPAGEAA